ncbi:hypothetical protein [Bradyrhizobium guangxiense]|uniref:hypothetical protein n=1 Tax=Bradyrhizobium guangxiense TaxID=1325115 RepID=UPI00100915B9|nr:hypothetical protein [Bradyrhizobium guangxiense]
MKVMMSSSAYGKQDIEDVLLKLWRSRNVILMNRFSANPGLCAFGGTAHVLAANLDPAQFESLRRLIVLLAWRQHGACCGTR